MVSHTAQIAFFSDPSGGAAALQLEHHYMQCL